MNDLEKKIKKMLVDMGYSTYIKQPLVIDGIYNEREEEYKRRIRLFSQLNLTNETIFDIGCNFGTNSFILKKLYPNVSIEAIDIDNKAIKFAKILNKYYKTYIYFHVQNLIKASYKNYDYVLISFLPNSFKYFFLMYLFLKLKRFKGKIILLYPNDTVYNENKELIKTANYFKNSKLIDNELIIVS